MVSSLMRVPSELIAHALVAGFVFRWPIKNIGRICLPLRFP